MWTIKHFKSEESAMRWVNSHAVQWNRIFVEAKVFSIEYRKLVKPRNPR